jgi:hypothetical protein
VIRDRDSKYSGPFDEAFRSEGMRIVKTPVRAPNANAVAERFVRTLRAECLDWLLILNRRHLERVLRVYVDHYNRERPHRALELRPRSPTSDGKARRRARSAAATDSAASSTSSRAAQTPATTVMAPFAGCACRSPYRTSAQAIADRRHGATQLVGFGLRVGLGAR